MAHILLIDDESLVVETLSSAIKSKGHTVVTASDGAEGLSRFSEQQFDLVITDLIMPNMGGLETIREMLRQKPNTKVVVISGGARTANVEVLKSAASYGALASLKKPIRLAEFFRVLDSCLNG